MNRRTLSVASITLLVILALARRENRGIIVGMGQYVVSETEQSAEVACLVRDDYQGQGIGTEIVSYLTYLAQKKGLVGFTAEVLYENKPMLRVFEKMGYDLFRRDSHFFSHGQLHN